MSASIAVMLAYLLGGFHGMWPDRLRWWQAAIFIALLMALTFWANGSADARDRNVPAEFQRQFPCPATGKPTGACPGWNKDHIIPLCRGGADTVANMQWLTVEQHKLKTRGDCRRLPG